MHPKQLKRRTVGLVIGIGLVFLLIGFRFWNLQVVHGAYYQQLAQQDYLRKLPTPAPRGNIVTADGVTIASYKPSWALYYLGQGQSIPAKEAATLAEYIGTTAQKLESTVATAAKMQPAYQPVLLASQLTPTQITTIDENRTTLPDLRIQPVATRYYPFGTMMGATLGYVGAITPGEWPSYQKQGYSPNSIVGQAGLELQYESYLHGKGGGQYAEVNPSGQLVKLIGNEVPVPGDTLHLTINWNLQQTAQNALQYVMHAMQTSPIVGTNSPAATQGAVIAVNPNNGDILALASLPTYNPQTLVPGAPGRNKYIQALSKIPGVFSNLVLTYALSPGSIFKPIVAVAALASHTITNNTIIFDPGYFPAIPSFHNWYAPGFGAIDLAQAIELSDDTFFYTLGYRMGIQTMDHWFNKFLLGTPTGVDLPGGNQNFNLVPTPQALQKATNGTETWTAGDNLNTAIGQGLDSFTLLSLARAESAIANGGTLYKPHLVSSITTAKGKVVKTFNPAVQGTLGVSPAVIQEVHKGMEMSAQDPQGTGYGAMQGIPLPVATKTGTAQLAGQANNSLFLTFAPAVNPKILIIVYIKSGLWGAHSGFVARAMYDQYFKLADPTAKTVFDTNFGPSYAWNFGYTPPKSNTP